MCVGPELDKGAVIDSSLGARPTLSSLPFAMGTRSMLSTLELNKEGRQDLGVGGGSVTCGLKLVIRDVQEPYVKFLLDMSLWLGGQPPVKAELG